MLESQFKIKVNLLHTGPPLPELSPHIVNTSGYIAFLFHFVVKEGASSLIIFTHYINALQASVRIINYTTQCTALFLFKRRCDHKHVQYNPQARVCVIFYAPLGTSPWQPKTRVALFSGVSGYLVLFALTPSTQTILLFDEIFMHITHAFIVMLCKWNYWSVILFVVVVIYFSTQFQHFRISYTIQQTPKPVELCCNNTAQQSMGDASCASIQANCHTSISMQVVL